MISAYSFATAAIARSERRHRDADSILFNSAGFHFDRASGRYVVTVRDHVVAEPKTIEDLRAFCEMHNGRVDGR